MRSPQFLVSVLYVSGFSTLFLASASPLKHIRRAELQSSYDFIIVGGGAAGLTLATRLSEVEDQNVLVLEAGQFPEVVGSYSTPGAGQAVLGSTLDWAFSTPAQESLGNRTITYHRGRGVGGSTLINGLTYGRGSSSIFDERAALGNNGWDWQSVFPYFQKSTSFEPVKVAPFQTYETSAYSSDGPITLSFPKFVSPTSSGFIEALRVINVSTVQDLDSGNNIGAKQEPLVLDTQQRRVSSYDGYFKPVRNRTNLSVISLAQVRQIILEMKNGTLTATGVVFTDSVSGNVMNVTATKEVILSAGVFQTPQLLMLSGIGPQQTLQQFGIPAYHTNENIGRHMQDHCYFSVIARVGEEVSASQLYNRIDLLQAAQKQYTENHTGPLTSPVGPTYGFQQIPATELGVLDTTGALGNRTNQAHIEYLWENSYYPSEPSTLLSQYPPNLNESFMSVTAAVLAPVSRGNISLQSNTIGDSPVINVNYLESEVDQRIALYGSKNLRKILSQPELANFTIGPDSGEVVPGVAITDDEALLTYIKSTLLPVWHASGTARMLPEADGGVVDDRLKVYGISGLRVVDASIIPVIPDQHIQGSVYMIAEKAADMIKEDYELVKASMHS